MATPVIFLDQLIYIVVLSVMGAALYAGVVFLLWYKQNNTDSAETWFLEKARSFVDNKILSRHSRPAVDR